MRIRMPDPASSSPDRDNMSQGAKIPSTFHRVPRSADRGPSKHPGGPGTRGAPAGAGWVRGRAAFGERTRILVLDDEGIARQSLAAWLLRPGQSGEAFRSALLSRLPGEELGAALAGSQRADLLQGSFALPGRGGAPPGGYGPALLREPEPVRVDPGDRPGPPLQHDAEASLQYRRRALTFRRTGAPGS